LKLTAVFDYTLALCIWQSFTVGNVKIDVRQPIFWEAAAEVLATQVNWTMLKLNKPEVLSGFVALPATATATAPEDIALSACGTGSPWANVTDDARPALLMVHNFMQVARMRQVGISQETCENVAVQVMTDNMNRIRLAKLGRVPQQAAVVSCGAYILCLRSALLLFKLVSILASPRIEDKQLQTGTVAVWSAIGTAALELRDQAKRHRQKKPIQHRAGEEEEEEGKLSELLVQMIVVVMRQTIKAESQLTVLTACLGCTLLEGLMPRSRPDLAKRVASEIVTPGETSCQAVHW